ncbi:MAG TPA: hypothetical protein ACFCUC_16230 [Desulfobacterales bacterium]
MSAKPRNDRCPGATASRSAHSGGRHSHCRGATLYHFLQAAFFFEKNHVVVVVVTIGSEGILQADRILFLDLPEAFAFVFVPFEKTAEVHSGEYVPVDCRRKHGGKIFHFFDELNGHAASPALLAVAFFSSLSKVHRTLNPRIIGLSATVGEHGRSLSVRTPAGNRVLPKKHLILVAIQTIWLQPPVRSKWAEKAELPFPLKYTIVCTQGGPNWENFYPKLLNNLPNFLGPKIGTI